MPSKRETYEEYMEAYRQLEEHNTAIKRTSKRHENAIARLQQRQSIEMDALLVVRDELDAAYKEATKIHLANTNTEGEGS